MHPILLPIVVHIDTSQIFMIVVPLNNFLLLLLFFVLGLANAAMNRQLQLCDQNGREGVSNEEEEDNHTSSNL
jgi:hypothetical protein